MTREDSLELLGLNIVFTEEELKKAYRKLAMKWHPDLYENASDNVKKEASEMMQKINEAYELLQKNIVNYNDVLKEDLNEILKNAKEFGVEYPYYYDTCYNKIYRFYATISKKEIKTEAEYKYIKGIIEKKIIIIYNELTALFCKEHHLSLEKVKKKMSYGCTLAQVYEQLLSKVEKNNKQKRLEESIDIVINSYKNNELYENLLVTMNKIKESYLKSFNNSDSISVYINEFKRELIRIFNIYELYKNRISNVEQNLDKIKFYNEKYLSNVSKAEKEYLSTYELYLNVLKHFKTGSLHESSLIALENKIEDNLRTIPIHIAKNIRNTINIRYNESALNQKSYKESDKVYCLASNLLNTMKPNDKNINTMYELTNLTFTNYLNDILILSSVNKNTSVYNSNIFIKDGHMELYQGIFNELIEKDGNLYMRSYGAVNKLFDTPVTFEEIFTNYISLDGMINIARFDGNMYYNGKDETIVLYKWDNRLLIINKLGELDVIDEPKLKFPYPHNDTKKYQNPEFLSEEIKANIYKFRQSFTLSRKNN